LHYIGVVIFHPSCDQICGNFFKRNFLCHDSPCYDSIH
jgi:hypothetical protein